MGSRHLHRDKEFYRAMGSANSRLYLLRYERHTRDTTSHINTLPIDPVFVLDVFVLPIRLLNAIFRSINMNIFLIVQF